MVIRQSQAASSKLVDKSILPADILAADSSDLTFSLDVDRFITLDGPPCRLEFSESLFGVHAPLDGSVALLQEVIPVIHASELLRKAFR